MVRVPKMACQSITVVVACVALVAHFATAAPSASPLVDTNLTFGRSSSLYWPSSLASVRNHSVCGSKFTVLTLFREDRAFMLCKIYSEIAMALVHSLQSLGFEAVAKCCQVGAPVCTDGDSASFLGSQVVLLDAIELYAPDAHVWGPVMLPARNTEVHPLVRSHWLPSDTSQSVRVCCQPASV